MIAKTRSRLSGFGVRSPNSQFYQFSLEVRMAIRIDVMRKVRLNSVHGQFARYVRENIGPLWKMNTDNTS